MLNLILVFIGHRLFLWLIALIAVTGDFFGMLKLDRHREVWQACLDRVAQTPEHSLVTARPDSLAFLEALRDPFIELIYWCARFSSFSVAGTLIVLSNIFFFLFLLELYRLLSRSLMPEMAGATAVLAVLWPASFELGLGSRLAFECWLLTLSLRCLLDNKWLYVGLGFSGFLLYDHRAIWFLPLFIYFFLYFQQHFQKTVVLRRLLFFVAPLVTSLWLTNFSWREILFQWRGSFLSQLWPPTQIFSLADSVGWPHFLGQFLSLGLLVWGAFLTFRSPMQFLYIGIPVSLGLYALAFIPWGAVGSRGVIATAALQGLSERMTRKQRTFLEAALVFFGAVEVFRVFH